jgi:hypothetical protein
MFCKNSSAYFWTSFIEISQNYLHLTSEIRLSTTTIIIIIIIIMFIFWLVLAL